MMEHPSLRRPRPVGFVRWFFGVPFRVQTYKNLAYLGLSFPLGTFYFAFLLTAIVTAGVLTVFLVGIPLFVLLLFAVRELTAWERLIAAGLLDVDIPAAADAPPDDAVGYLKDLVLDFGVWKGLVYLAARWFIGLFVFVLLVMLGSMAFAMLLVPLYYQNPNATVGIHVGNPVELAPSLVYEVDAFRVALTVPFRLTDWHVDTLPEAVVFSLGGVLLGIAALHVFNLTAWLHGQFARIVLRGTRDSELGRALSD